MVLILPLLYFIDFLLPLINHPDLLFESPVSVIITIGISILMFITGELVKPIYSKLFKDFREVK